MGQNNFGRVPIVLNGSNSFWLEPNHFGQAQIIKISPEKSNLNLTKMIWTKQFELVIEDKALISFSFRHILNSKQMCKIPGPHLFTLKTQIWPIHFF